MPCHSAGRPRIPSAMATLASPQDKEVRRRHLARITPSFLDKKLRGPSALETKMATHHSVSRQFCATRLLVMVATDFRLTYRRTPNRRD
jgi:hypothetical protein